MASRGEDPYQILGLSPGATPAQIRAAYLSAVKRYHPDKHRDNPLADLATRELAAINQAYAALTKDDRRAPEAGPGGRGPAAPGEPPPPSSAAATRFVRAGLALVGLIIVAFLAARVLPPIGRLLVAAGTAVVEGLDGAGGGWTAGAAIAILLLGGLLVLLARRHRRQRRAR